MPERSPTAAARAASSENSLPLSAGTTPRTARTPSGEPSAAVTSASPPSTDRSAAAGDAEGYLTPGWLPGEAQVNFEKADLGVRGVVDRGRRPAVTFPRPGMGPAQAFCGETSECVCQGLRTVFEFAGGVPRRAIYDNSAEFSGRVRGEDGLSDLFRCFTYCAHINTVANKTAYDKWLVVAI